jgi:acyl-[acyl-carrier-protein]-phospholipid O-acyltransferase/long-chain-fatty-acid--[acyl-carrier-protein] ligase
MNLLATKRFLPLFVTQFFGAFNDNAFKNAVLIWFTYEIAVKTGQNAGVILNLAAALFILPFFLFSAISGQLADKYEKSWLIRRVKLTEIVLMCGCMVGFYLQSIVFLLFILFMMGLQSTLFGPLKYSLLPEHLKKSELLKGNAIIEGGTFLSILLGTMFGGLVIRLEYGIELISFFVILFAIVGFVSANFIPKSSLDDPKLKMSFNIFKKTCEIIRDARKEKTVFLSILGISWFWFLGIVFLTQFPVYAKNVLGANEQVVTLFLATFSIGIGIGSYVCNKILKGEINGRLAPISSLMMSIFIFIFYYLSKIYPHSIDENNLINLAAFLSDGYGIAISFSLLVMSIFAGMYSVPLYAIMQDRSEHRIVARIIAANNVTNAFFMVIATLCVVALFSLGVQVEEVLLVVGFLNLFVYFVVRNFVKSELNK